MIGFRVDGIELQVATVAGEDASAVALKIAAAGVSALSVGGGRMVTVGTFSQQSIADPGLDSSALVPLLSDGALGVLGLFLFVAGVVVLFMASRASRQRQPS